ncbi:MAG: MarR family transcriptional regulator [Limnothrix sp. RL_2_0]|nr:MarR family transcriptional regulator [Limnothrix sp. RL_2_0]
MWSVRQTVQSWFSQAQATVSETEEELVPLPDVLENQLAQKIRALPSPEIYQSFIREELAIAIETWQQNLDAPNSLVFLGSPVEPIAAILNDGLRQWSDAPVNIITPLPCMARPEDPLVSIQQIRDALDPYTQLDPDNQEDADEQLDPDSLDARQTVVLIPCLEQCFLRCIGGWEGIEYLRDVAIHHRHCFWVIGCSHWAWNFLDFVCQVSAYFSEVKSLPELNGEVLKEWLDPVVKTVIAAQAQTEEDGDRPDYWHSLASKALGVSSIAVNIWLQSLRIDPELVADGDKSPDLNLASDNPEGEELILHEVKPSLPSFPSLNHGDRYLLHSLLIHGRMTRAHLAFSLGQREGQIQSQIQALLRTGLLERNDGCLSVQPSHYVRLKTELANNNFFVGDD